MGPPQRFLTGLVALALFALIGPPTGRSANEPSPDGPQSLGEIADWAGHDALSIAATDSARSTAGAALTSALCGVATTRHYSRQLRLVRPVRTRGSARLGLDG